MKKNLRAGIVGCGRIASSFDNDPKRNYVATHAGAYRKVLGVDLVAACDLDPARLQEFGKRWNVQNLYNDFDQMLEVENLDLVSVCTWPGSHYLLCEKAIRKGIRGIFCEKPITHRLSDADELVKLVQKNKLTFAVNHSRRWDADHLKVRDFLKSGKIGQIHHVNAYYTAGISNTGTHLFDLLRVFLGEAEWIQMCPAPVFGDKDLSMSGQVYFQNGTLVTLCGLDVKDYLIFEIDFYGSKGRLRITHSGFGVETWKVAPSPFFSGYQELSATPKAWAMKKKKMIVDAVSDIITAVRSGKPTRSTVVDGRQALELVAAANLSYKSGKRVALPLKNREVEI